MILEKLIIKLRRNKILYYAKSYLRQIVPAVFYEKVLKERLLSVKLYDENYITERVNYYNKLDKFTPVGEDAVSLADMKTLKGPKAYYFDTFEFSRYFDNGFKANLLFKDVIHIPDVPTLQKSRPIAGDNANAVLLKLDKKRHFLFINDKRKFAEKKDMLIGRGVIEQPHRMRFMDMYFDHPFCDLGQVNKINGNPKWLKPKISISDHLEYKFILSLEGNDVATNLKWIMSSHSVAVMPKPKYETWFMEGKLIPDFHYILIRDDYSDLVERLEYYINHPEKAQAIIKNANEYVKQFFDKKRESLISLLVLQKYFYWTSQTDQVSSEKSLQH